MLDAFLSRLYVVMMRDNRHSIPWDCLESRKMFGPDPGQPLVQPRIPRRFDLDMSAKELEDAVL